MFDILELISMQSGEIVVPTNSGLPRDLGFTLEKLAHPVATLSRS